MEVIKGSDLKLLLKKKGITSQYISDKLMIHRTSISRYFTDDIAMPATFLIKVAALANLQMSDLVKYDVNEAFDIISEPPVEYKKSHTPSALDNTVSILVDGIPIADKLHNIERDMLLILEKLKDMEKKSNIKYKELEVA